MSFTATTYRFTTLARIQLRLSTAGTTLRIDDAASTAVDDCILDATNEILGYTAQYDTESLALSNWVELRARDIAAYFVCTRRGNPAPAIIEKRYEKAIAELEKVMSGAMTIPDAALRAANVPKLTNQRVATYPFPRVVNVEGTSTSGAGREGYVPHTDRTDTMDYSI